ncbi:uncharacterized protein RB166_015752 isoform 2-T2 [Leptodactylus fuscus]|uniref:uncharacterized protein LOC142217554 isoform X2 n=1 Tax=Leptodactylus fuscus TaxID=238119 RepID=UPI003F4EF7B9
MSGDNRDTPPAGEREESLPTDKSDIDRLGTAPSTKNIYKDNHDTAPPADNMDIEPSTSTGYIQLEDNWRANSFEVSPTGNKDTAPPTDNNESMSSANNKDTASPIDDKDTLSPKENTASPANNKDTAPPADNKETVSPIDDKDTLSPKENTESPADNKYTESLTDNMYAMSPTYNKDTLSPKKDTASPANNKDTVSPINNKDTVSSIDDKDAESLTDNKYAISPTYNNDTLSPKKNTVSPINNKDTETPLDNKDSVSTIDNKDSPIDNKHTESPTNNKDTVSPIDFKDNKCSDTSIDNKDIVSPTGNKDTVSPPDNTNTGNTVEQQKTLKEGAIPSSTDKSGSRSIAKSLGIFNLETYIDTCPLVTYLADDIGPCAVIPISLDNERDWRLIERFTSAVIIYTSQTSVSCLKRFRDFCSDTLGSENMVMVRIDFEDTESLERKKSLLESDQYPRCPLVTLTKTEWDAINKESVENKMANKLNQMKKILRPDAEIFGHRISWLSWLQKRLVVGIFSRDAESQYSWLVTALTSDIFKSHIGDVQLGHISNSGFKQFCEAVSQCTYGILYHSKTRGRVNVTDVTDSLYDEELKYLCSKLGKQKVIVVIDDLEDSRDKQRNRILDQQPSIRDMAQDLFLISPKEKTSNYQRFLTVNREEVERKLQRLRGIIKRWKTAETKKTEKSEDGESKKTTGHDTQVDAKKDEKSEDEEKKNGTDQVSQEKAEGGEAEKTKDHVSQSEEDGRSMAASGGSEDAI